MLLSNPNARFPEQWLDAAARQVDASLYEVGIDRHVFDYRLRAARCRVRRVVAALCGIDVDDDLAGTSAQRFDAAVVVERETVVGLQEALLNPTVVAAIEKAVGSEKAAAVLGSVSLLG